jgi:hypothetical protein
LTAHPSRLYPRLANLLPTLSSTLAAPLSSARCPSHPPPFLPFLYLLDVVSRQPSANKGGRFVQQSTYSVGTDDAKDVPSRTLSLHSSLSHSSTPSLRRALRLPLTSQSTSPVPTGFKGGLYLDARRWSFYKAARRSPSVFFETLDRFPPSELPTSSSSRSVHDKASLTIAYVAHTKSKQCLFPRRGQRRRKSPLNEGRPLYAAQELL